MGLFDKIRGQASKVTLDAQKAVMTVMVAAVKADGNIEDDEVAQIRSLCAWSPIFARNSKEQDTALIVFADNFTADEGLEGAVRKAGEALSTALRETAFCFATKIAFADGYLGEKEKAFLSQLVSWLKIEEDRARQIVEVVAIDNNDTSA